MNFSEPFIRRPVMTAVLTLSAIFFGVVSYFRLPVNDLPAVDYPVIQVMVAYPGAAPEIVANTIAAPLERQFMQINGLELVTSRSTQGQATLTLQFDLDKNIDAAATDVQTAISQATGVLPTDLPAPPTFSKTNPNDQPIMYIAMTSDSVTLGQVYDYANTQVGQRLSILPGVNRVLVFGTKSAVRIKADPSALAARNLSIDDLAAAVRGGTSTTGAGQLDGASMSEILRPQGQIEDAEAYGNLIVATRNGSPVYVRNLATVKDSVQDERLNMRFWARGHDVPAATVIVAVFRQAGANAVEVAKAIRDVMPSVQRELPTAVRITPVYDRSRTIVRSVVDVQETLVIAFVLVVVVIFAFLGRATDTLIPAVALPLSLLLTFIAMRILGYSLDNLSLMALTLAIGFLVDDAIVFLENTVRRMERGEKALEATLGSAREISFTILSMTISLAAVFIPLIFMSGLMGRIFREFAVTIVVSIIASGIVSLTLTPLMCARLLKDRGPGHRQTFIERTVGRLEKWFLGIYSQVLMGALKHHWISFIAFILCFVGTGYLWTRIPKTFLPPGDSSTVWGVLIGREGSSPQQMKHLQDRAEEVIHNNPDVLAAFTMTGGNFLPSNMGLTFIMLKDVGERPPIQQVTMELMGGMMGVPGLFPGLQPFKVLEISTGATEQTQGQYAFSVSGIDPEQVYSVSDQLMARFQTYPGFQFIRTDRYANTPNLDVHLKRDRTRALGVSEARILTLLRNAYSQNYVYLIKKTTDQYQVIVEVEDAARKAAGDLSLLYIRSDDGRALVPLKELATWSPAVGPQSVNHINQFPSVSFFFNLKPGATIGAATEFVQKVAAEVVPPALRSSFQGEALTFQNATRDLLTLMALAVFVMYVILAILYESYLHPVTVLSTLPTALVGGLAALLVFKEEASLYAYVGMFMLMGIVKKNGILIVDFAIQRRLSGENAVQAIHDASVDRFRPILMTTLAAVFGALPIALGFGADGASRRPLGLVIVGGLVVSQFITLFVTPVIYLYLEWVQENVLNRTSFFRSTQHKHGVVVDVIEEAKSHGS